MKKKRIVSMIVMLVSVVCALAVTALATLKGDVNADGAVNAIDAAATLQFVTGLVGSIDADAADMEGDGRVAATDAALMLRYVAPVPSAAPIVTATPAAAPVPTASPTVTPSAAPEPHVHSWTFHEEAGHLESVKTGTEEVTVGTYWEEIGGWDEDRAAFYQCNICGDTFATNSDAGDHLVSAHHGSYSYFPAESVHHDGEWVQRTKYETRDVYGPVWVVDSAAYWVCSCGETRYDEP